MAAAPFARLEQRLTAVVIDRLSNVVAHTASGSVPALFEIDSTEFFDSKGADFTLRYAGPNTLARGDIITVSGSQLVADNTELLVAEKPKPIGTGTEYIAQLVRAA